MGPNFKLRHYRPLGALVVRSHSQGSDPAHDCGAPAPDDILHAACSNTYDSAYWS